jgi:hypothetical protein
MTAHPLPSVDRFVSIAAEFMAWIDRTTTLKPNDMLALHWLLARLQIAVIELPAVTSNEKSIIAAEHDSRSHPNLLATLAARFEVIDLDRYRTILFLLDDQSEPLDGSLADDLTDIYRDVESGLAYAREGKYPEAVWEWRFLYFSHWGYHLAGAQACLRQYLDQNAASWFEPPHQPSDNG